MYGWHMDDRFLKHTYFYKFIYIHHFNFNHFGWACWRFFFPQRWIYIFTIAIRAMSAAVAQVQQDVGRDPKFGGAVFYYADIDIG